MSWTKNEFYEALKGKLIYRRVFHLIIQFFIGMFLLIPVFLVSLLSSMSGRGPVLKLVLRKGNE